MSVHRVGAARDLRGVPSLRRLRGRRAAVIVCRDHPEPFEAIRDDLDRLGADLVAEPRAGPLSQLLGRPAVVVADRYLDVVAAAADLSPQAALETLAWADSRCEECPQSADEAPDLAAAWRAAQIEDSS